jgi:hypothetical protein
MHLWDDSLRICPKCRKPVCFHEESQLQCPHCQSVVWFFNYRPVADPPPIPPNAAIPLWEDQRTLLLIATGAMALALAVAAIFGQLWAVMVLSFCICGMSAYAFVQHGQLKRLQDEKADAVTMRAFAEHMRTRNAELVRKYNSLLATGNSRIEQYYGKVDQWRKEVAQLEQDAKALMSQAESVELRCATMAERFINDHRKWIAGRTKPDPESFIRNRDQLIKAFNFVESIGHPTPKEIETSALRALKSEYEQKVKEAALKDEQRRIAQRMREEEKVRRERELALVEAEAREKEIEARLERALLEVQGENEARVQELQKQLEEAKLAAQRAKSMAELTKVGHVYILSNIGSFGEDIYKVGMTRRLEPLDRVHELGDASVPFPFDVHAMIYCENAPQLENQLHRVLSRHRVNRVNLRKEFFAVDLDTILAAVEQHHGVVEYVAKPEALQYRESQNISPEDVAEVEEELEAIGMAPDDGDL